MNTELELKAHAIVKLLHKLNLKCKSAQELINLGGFPDDMQITESDINTLWLPLINFGALDGLGTEIALTEGGKLWAQELIEEDINNYKAKIPIVEVRAYINNWLPQIPMYGEFTFPDYPSQRFILLQSTEEAEYKEKLLREKDVRDEAMSYLIFDGFATNRHDIDKSSGVLYRELTDRGRELKVCGSLERFDNKITTRNKEREDEIQFKKDYSKIQNQLSKNQIQTNDSTITTNGHLRENNVFLNKVFKWTIVLTICGLVVSVWSLYYTSQNNLREQNKERKEAKQSKSDSILQLRNSEMNSLRKENDSLKNVLRHF